MALGSRMMDKIWLNRAATLKGMLWDLYHGRGTISRKASRFDSTRGKRLLVPLFVAFDC
jgi:hypothetical protein